MFSLLCPFPPTLGFYFLPHFLHKKSKRASASSQEHGHRAKGPTAWCRKKNNLGVVSQFQDWWGECVAVSWLTPTPTPAVSLLLLWLGWLESSLFHLTQHTLLVGAAAAAASPNCLAAAGAATWAASMNTTCSGQPGLPTGAAGGAQ